MSRHPMQRLTKIRVIGNTPARDPEYGIVYTIVDQTDMLAAEIAEEVEFDTIETGADGYVHLMLGDDRVARVAMSGPHADDHLVVLDPVR